MYRKMEWPGFPVLENHSWSTALLVRRGTMWLEITATRAEGDLSHTLRVRLSREEAERLRAEIDEALNA
jgi:hypothetical protein